MKKLTIEEKKSVNAGSASMMGIATGILTVTGVFNLIFDILNRYFRRGARENQIDSPSCDISIENCMEAHPEFWTVPEEPSNRITIFSDKSS